ncbi:hypothetical protein NE619_10480 [Anaerovorax odorimutans]|uniref:Phage tail protein n=1 Tax=Anaerovorax odorimutans TaxID=109327 RepID=A0ABT1RPP0_9FIRM|nr:hypothetical protein [Anaerovorax odorimutans]MCQ4637152.1 hypothetical protein [Anaerovorax odorimutans]
MSKNTKNIGFVLPDANDFYDISVPNGNFEKADAALKKLEDEKVSKEAGKSLSANDLTNDLKTKYDAAHEHLSNEENPHQTTAAQVGAIPTSQKGAASGIAELDANGKVPSAQLPSYVDDVLEFSSKEGFPAVGESGKIYVATNTNLTYRWAGSAYVEISASLALGETASTAYRGDKGKQNAADIAALENNFAALISEETIEKAKEAGIDLTSGGGGTKS